MQHITCFSEHRRGKFPSEFTPRINPIGHSSRVEGSFVDSVSRNSLLITSGSTQGHTIYSWNILDLDANSANQELFVIGRIRTNGGEGEQLRLWARVSGTSSANHNGYQLIVGPGNSLRKFVNGSGSVVSTYSKTFGDGSFICAVLRVNTAGPTTTISYKVWLYGDTEPVGWDGSYVDASPHASGWIGPAAVFVDSVFEYKVLSVATNGDSTLRESDLPESFHTWLGRQDETMEVTLRAEYYNPASGLVEERWLSNYPRPRTAIYDYPPDTDFLPLLTNISSINSRLESDIQFGGLVSSQRSQIELDNAPSTPTGPGPLSNWHDYSFYGRPLEIRIGKRYKTRSAPGVTEILNLHRTFEIYDCLIANSDPDVSTRKVTIPVGVLGQEQQNQGATNNSNVSLSTVAGNKTPPIGALSNRLPVNINIGIPVGIKALTNTAYISIPNHAQYAINSWRVSARIYIPTSGIAGSGSGWISRWFDGVSAYKWSLGFGYASHPTVGNRLFVDAHASDSTLLFSYIHPTLINDGKYHSVILAVNDKDRWYLILDGVRIAGASGLTKSSRQPVTAIEALRVMPGCVILDHRIEKFVSEEEAIDRFAVRRDADANTLSIHRCDDNAGAGTSVTDYGPTANSATLVGTDNVDRIYTPTYLGSPELTGVYMPMSGGVLYNSPAQTIDPVREIFRYNDRVKTSGTTLGVRAKGLSLAASNYTEPAEGPGTWDMNAASDQPMTFGLSASGTPEDQRIHLPRVLRDEIFNRGAVSNSTCDSDSFSAIRQALPLRGGVSYVEPPTIAEFLSNSLSPIGCNYMLRQGRIVTSCLLPPLNPGPFGYGPIMEFLGFPDRGVTLSHDTSYSLTQSGTFSLTLTFKLLTYIVPDPSVSSTFTYFPAGQTLIDKAGTLGSGYYIGFDGRDGGLIFATPGFTSGAGLHYRKVGNYNTWIPGIWYVIVANVNNNADRSLAVRYVKPGTTDVIDVGDFATSADLSCSGTMTANTLPIKVGYGIKGSFTSGSIGYIFGCSPGQGTPFLQADPITDGIINGLSGPDELRNGAAIERFKLFLNEGYGDLSYETVIGRAARVEGTRWSPRMILDTRKSAMGNIPSVKRANALWRAETRYRMNRAILSGADIVASVSASERASLGQPFLYDVSAMQNVRDNFLNSREVTLTTDLLSSGEPITKMLRLRLTTDRRLAGVSDWYRDIARLDVGDEALLYDDVNWNNGKAARVVMSDTSIMQDKGNLLVWG